MAFKITSKSAADPAREASKENQRAAPRQRRLRTARLVFNDVVSSVDCRLRDISDTGAGLECESTIGIPDHVVLNLREGGIFDADVVWRTPTRLGLRFRENAELASVLKDLSQAVAEVLPHLRKIMELAQSAAQGEQGRLGRPRLSGDLARLSEHGGELLLAFREMADDYGDGR